MRRVMVNVMVCATASAAAAGVGGVDAAHATNVIPFVCQSGAPIVGSGIDAAAVAAEAAAYNATCNGMVSYTAGLASVCSRDVQFSDTDVPYSDQQWLVCQAGAGTDASHLETFPLAEDAVGVAFDNPCIPNGFEVTGTIIGQIYAGKVTDWSEIDPACPGAITSVFHRSGVSGTTSAFKAYLTKKDPLDFAAGCVNTAVTPPTVSCYKDPTAVWPNGTGVACGGGNTNAAMATCVSGTPGSIGYVDESDAAPNGPNTFAVDNAGGTPLDVLYVLLDEGGLIGNLSVVPVVGPTVVSTVAGVEDTIDGVLSIVDGPGALGFSTPASGACTAAAQAGVTPVSPAADWADVDITDAANGYAICNFLYQLVFDTPVHAGVATATQAITIANFTAFEVTDMGQAVFAANRLDPLPLTLQASDQVAANELLAA